MGGSAADDPSLRMLPARPWGRTWIAAHPAYMRRASHALTEGGRVWLIDPVDGPGLDEAIAGLGSPAGVVQLLDRHGRDCAALAERLGVPLHRNPVAGVPGAPFLAVPLAQRRLWREVALWWPGQRVLVVAEALGTAPYQLAPGRSVGVHPGLRLVPPRALAGLGPRARFAGHGEAIV
jgi:hypothetical protein